MFIPFSLLAFFRTSFFCLQGKILQTIVLGLVFLSLFCLFLNRCARSICTLSSPSFSLNTFCSCSWHCSRPFCNSIDSQVVSFGRVFQVNQLIVKILRLKTVVIKFIALHWFSKFTCFSSNFFTFSSRTFSVNSWLCFRSVTSFPSFLISSSVFFYFIHCDF